MSNLYLDPQSGKEVVTNSSLKVFRQCPQLYRYKYIERLKIHAVGRPLKFGSWMHELLEWHHSGDDWTIKHHELTMQFNRLMDEEKEYYGDLPHDCAALMRSYIWYYRDDPWKVIKTEFTIEFELPNGVIYRGRVDALAETQFGLHIVDHKNHARLPDLGDQLLDSQSAMYLWTMLKKKYDVEGFIWNYLVTQAPAKPKALKDGSRLSKKLGSTDYLTFRDEVRRLVSTGELARITPEMKEYAAKLKLVRYQPGEPQVSPFFRRDVLRKGSGMLGQVARENYHTIARLKAYPFHRPEIVERATSYSCKWCGYRDLCTIELMGGNSQYLRKNKYQVGDPMDYYKDTKESTDA